MARPPSSCTTITKLSASTSPIHEDKERGDSSSTCKSRRDEESCHEEENGIICATEGTPCRSTASTSTLRSTSTRTTRSAHKKKMTKAPGAPLRFKTAYIFFSTWKHKDLRANLIKKQIKTTEVAKMVSHAWKTMPPSERYKWDELARIDKLRYNHEKALYTGPWTVEAPSRLNGGTGTTHATERGNLPPRPRRPLSAALVFSNTHRSILRRKFPKSNNSDLSIRLMEMWRELPRHEKQVYLDREATLRAKYKRDVRRWKEATTTVKNGGAHTVTVANYNKNTKGLFPYLMSSEKSMISSDDEDASGGVSVCSASSISMMMEEEMFANYSDADIEFSDEELLSAAGKGDENKKLPTCSTADPSYACARTTSRSGRVLSTHKQQQQDPALLESSDTGMASDLVALLDDSGKGESSDSIIATAKPRNREVGDTNDDTWFLDFPAPQDIFDDESHIFKAAEDIPNNLQLVPVPGPNACWAEDRTTVNSTTNICGLAEHPEERIF